MGKALRAIYLDLGGVLLTNGWDTKSRKHAAEKFGLDWEAMQKRHSLMYSTHELGKLSLDTYLEFTVFYEKRSFSLDDFKQFMFEQSQPYSEMLDLIKRLKKEHHLKIGVVSNEGRELTAYRVKNWLADFVDFFCVSGFVNLRKPDPDIFRLALYIGQMEPEEVIYIEDRKQFVEIANGLGMHGVHHTSYEKTKETLEGLLR